LEETVIGVIDESGQIVKEGRTASKPPVLYEALRKVDLPLERIGSSLLAGGLAFRWSSRRMFPAICIETRRADAAMQTMPNKTDRMAPARWHRSCAPAGTRQVDVRSRQRSRNCHGTGIPLRASH
jgi:hypothetical protein